MYEIAIRADFSAAHRLKEYRGNCARWHGHNWAVTVRFQAPGLNRLGMAMDFREAKDHLKEVLARVDHTDLNQIPEFAEQNPTSELIARFVFREMARRCDSEAIRVVRVDVSETGSTSASYFE